jgi:N-acyl homoserine lactone hydrolase
MVKRVWILRTGTLKLDRSILLLGRGYGVKETVPVYTVLLGTSDGYILIDTGMNPAGKDDPEGTWGERAKLIVPKVGRKDDIRYRLDEIGVSPDDVKYVINTHLHWDHTGGNRFFPKATFFVQNAEYRYAYHPDTNLGASYMRNHFDHELNYRLLDGDEDVANGVRIMMTPGHTPGHQSVLATFETGKSLLIAGDAAYTFENIEKRIPPGNCYDYTLSVQSLHKLITVAHLTGASILPSHDPTEDFFMRIERAAEEAMEGNC